MIQIDRQKYVPLSSTLRKCKAIERKRDFKREKMFLAESRSTSGGQHGRQQPKHHQLQEVDSIKTMHDVKEQERVDGMRILGGGDAAAGLTSDRHEVGFDEYGGGGGVGDYSMMSVSSCCFSEDVLQEHTLMRAN